MTWLVVKGFINR